jgi:hypothetical protein
MPIGSSKLGVLGAGLVPGGTETFNAPGTFSIPPGVKKVSITGKGGSGNPGTSGTAGNSGTPGLGGGGGGGSPAPSPNCMLGGRPGGGFFTNFPPNPGGFGGLTGEGQAIPGGTVGNSGGTGSSGSGGSAGSAGCAGNPGQCSSGLGNNFAGGTGGNAGNAGAAGTGGSGGVGGARGPSCPAGPSPNIPGASGSGGGGPGGASGIGPAGNRNAGGGGGGGAGVANDGGAGADGTNNVQTLNSGKGGTTSGFCVQFASFDPLPQGGFSGPTATTGGSTGLRFGTPMWAGNALGLRGNPTNNPRDYRCFCQAPNPFPQSFSINNNPQRCTIVRTNPAVRSGAGGGLGSEGAPSFRSANGGAAGGGRGNAGNAGGCGGAGGTGVAGTPATFNCVPVTPGCTAPITVGSPGGQIVISWNPQ